MKLIGFTLKSMSFILSKNSKMQLFYNGLLNENSTEIFFDKEESNHIIKSLRKKIGDTLYITNGKGSLFEATIFSDNVKNCIAQIISCKNYPLQPYYLHIAIAPTKMNDRFEWFLEKATEIGISEITPLITEHSERKTINKERFERIILSAMKQSLQVYKPILNDAISFVNFVKKDIKGIKFIAHCQKEDKRILQKELYKNNVNEILMLIGPEGDFSEKEIQKTLEMGFVPVSFGEHRLRTETAGIVACNAVSDIFLLKK
jgi:RNA methyltransferase, rsmE family